MKALVITFTSVLVGMVMAITGHQSFAEANIEHDTNNVFVVEFNEYVDLDSSAVANVENVANATAMYRPYGCYYVFTVEDGSYEKLQSICESVKELPEVKNAHTRWVK
ncbi:hypothetical protein NXH67_02370 [Butyrivibrio sp. DSM 10294]|uniref:hypothetical protein n=1 Tax=Butyrivibrio sp. DSM 10294 TaxID=2972457 RepID=UPI00234F6210|nr:hypothetical protein [Butyrivibrio sp. DSM 10294]MDC7292363.1 hypothetical protein [Butyrivibrio sp. DSM 10294]